MLQFPFMEVLKYALWITLLIDTYFIIVSHNYHIIAWLTLMCLFEKATRAQLFKTNDAVS